MVKVVFIKDFATKKKGDTMELGSMVASDLIHKKKVAKLYKKPIKKVK